MTIKRREEAVQEGTQSDERPSNGSRHTRPAKTTLIDGLPRAITRADLALKTGQYEEAVRISRAVLDNHADHIAALEILAKALWQAGHYDEVLLAVRRLQTLNPYEPGYHALKGAALQCLGRYGESVRAFARAGNAPGSEEAMHELESWQGGLIADMLREDPVFRAHYAQNPADACACRGFDFVSGRESQDRWLSNPTERAALFARPS